ncbi:50S ribosomal protein L5 [Candidatus Parcubacteria bacterium]|jgi:large subunit ribosomal protein L5|nr:MAG: 50S ribosomal protein L5 [Candidatus Parcubacteria bacterium]
MKNLTPRLLEKYRKIIIPTLMKDLGLANVNAVPKIHKIVINSSFGNGLKDAKLQEVVVSTLTRISGQKPVLTKARKSISAFKVRKGMAIGASVTLRGHRMYEFLDKLINVALPRIRDFRGVSPEALDQQGNFSIGFKEHLAFPEIRSDEVEKIHGLEVVLCTTAQNPKTGQALLHAFGFPFREDVKTSEDTLRPKKPELKSKKSNK